MKLGVRSVQKLLRQVAFDPSQDPTWTIVGEGVSNDYFLGRAKEAIRDLGTTSDKRKHLITAIRMLVMYYATTHSDEDA